MAVDRRNPKRPPPLADLLPRDPRRAGALLEKYLKKLGIGAYIGLPAPHAHTHAPGEDDALVHGDTHLPSGTDPITTQAPSGKQFDDPAEEGSAEALARADHVHSKPTAEQVRSALKQESLAADIRYALSRRAWVNVYASNNFR